MEDRKEKLERLERDYKRPGSNQTKIKQHVDILTNLMAGAEVMNDAGYSIGTKEGYEAFAKKRNESLK